VTVNTKIITHSLYALSMLRRYWQYWWWYRLQSP